MTDLSAMHERITAYLDGAMSESEAEAFEQDLAEIPELAAEMERLAGNDALLRDAFPEPAMDAAFLARLGLAEPAVATDAPAAPAVPANDNPPFWQRWKAPLGVGIAACLALVAVFSLQSSGEASTFAEALETVPSGKQVALADGASLRPVLSFAAGDGRYCREFAYSAGSGATGGIACRDAGGWQVEAWGGDAAQMPEAGAIVLADGAQAASLEDAYRRLEASDPLQTDREATLIERGWMAE